MAWLPVRIVRRLTLGIVLLLILTSLAIYAVMTLRGKPLMIEAGGLAVQQSATAMARQLELQLNGIQGTAAALAHLAETLPNDAELVKSQLPNLIDSQGDQAIAGGGIWPEPDAFAPGVSKYSFFWMRDDAGRLQFSDDYNQPDIAPYQDESWYSGAVHAAPGRCVWSDAYQDPVSKVVMTTCSVPYLREGRVAGVATLDLKLDELAGFLTREGDVTGGYAFAVDAGGQFLYFPEALSGDELATLDSLAEKAPGYADTVALLNEGGSGPYPIDHDPRLDGPAYVSVAPISMAGWRVALITPAQRVTGLADRLTGELLVFLLPLLALLLGGAWLMARHLLLQIRETAEQIRHLEHGDSTAALPIERPDEIGDLREAVNHYAGTLRGLFGRIGVEASTLERQASELAGLSQGLSERAEAQRSDNNLLATAITQMSASAEEVASNTTDCSATATEALQQAQQGQRNVQRNSEAIEQLAEEVGSAAQAIKRLGDDIERVSEVLGVIESISEQTNLLALNAAIEAARAGEMGRGFAVVADEVRTLAGRTQGSAREIHEMIAELRSASRDAVTAMSNGAERTRETVAQASGISQTLGATVQSFEDIVQRAQHIAQAAKEQSQVAHEISELAVRIHAAGEQGARDAATLNDVGQGMLGLSERLGRMSRGQSD